MCVCIRDTSGCQYLTKTAINCVIGVLVFAFFLECDIRIILDVHAHASLIMFRVQRHETRIGKSEQILQN